jgi:hypothetical protein
MIYDTSMLRTLSDIVFFGPGLYTMLVVLVIVGVALGVFGDKIDATIRKLLIAVAVIVFLLWVISLLSGAPVWVR